MLSFFYLLSRNPQILTKSQVLVSKRSLQLIDNSGFEVTLTLWRDKAVDNINWHDQPVVALKNLRVSEFHGISLSTSNDTHIELNPSLREGYDLWHWRVRTLEENHGILFATNLTTGGTGGSMDAFLDRKSVVATRTEDLGHGEKTDYFTSKATIIFFRRDPTPWYKSCPSDGCKRKVVENAPRGTWACEKCAQNFNTVRT